MKPSASLPEYAQLKKLALSAILEMIEVDSPVPDEICFRREKVGFSIKLSFGSLHSRTLLTWDAISLSNRKIVFIAAQQLFIDLMNHDVKTGK